ncbi:hypothetical protein Ahy_B03g063870 isoform D [Arachis hypogaea]|uniref:Copine C-terminal domain-containing protein n=1 Tax=Arachis hypogaea TaxID=3818 RepID=A0A444ZY52_ARAHY|nr:hypothetical protein Ahy_B03g063870 isoform D [Arachis hypogaea]
MMAYASALLNVSLAGPTHFGPVISNAALTASQSVATGARKYFVLLIITDGVVTDLQETKDALVKASDLPLSILIILDAAKGERLESSFGRVASRDIVQFVPFRDVQSGEISVVQALLAELPTQFLSWEGGHKEYDGLTFVAIRGAGHEVPLHRSKLALSLFKSFIAGTSMPTLQLVNGVVINMKTGTKIKELSLLESIKSNPSEKFIDEPFFFEVNKNNNIFSTIKNIFKLFSSI